MEEDDPFRGQMKRLRDVPDYVSGTSEQDSSNSEVWWQNKSKKHCTNDNVEENVESTTQEYAGSVVTHISATSELSSCCSEIEDGDSNDDGKEDGAENGAAAGQVSILEKEPLRCRLYNNEEVDNVEHPTVNTQAKLECDLCCSDLEEESSSTAY
jgi:hypothetical protein